MHRRVSMVSHEVKHHVPGYNSLIRLMQKRSNTPRRSKGASVLCTSGITTQYCLFGNLIFLQLIRPGPLDDCHLPKHRIGYPTKGLLIAK